jgi:uncharacterized membrane protein YbhN (UPF0104 family)
LSFGISLFFLFLGFVFSGLSWWYSLKVHKINIDMQTGVLSHGLPIFAKYIPGKVWTILGRASKVSQAVKNDTAFLSFISLKEQFVYLLVGIVISIVPIYTVYGFNYFFILVLLSGIGLYLVIFNKLIHRLITQVFEKILKKKLDIPLITHKNGFKLSVFNVLLWISWTLAFYFFSKSVAGDFGINQAFVFPISVVYGVLAIIMPGGIGVREGIITAFLTTSGMELEVATTISVASRLWFILGEIFVFILSLILQFSKR